MVKNPHFMTLKMVLCAHLSLATRVSIQTLRSCMMISTCKHMSMTIFCSTVLIALLFGIYIFGERLGALWRNSRFSCPQIYETR